MWKEVIGEVDIDGNGEIDFNEFQLMMSKIISDEKQEHNVHVHHKPQPNVVVVPATGVTQEDEIQTSQLI